MNEFPLNQQIMKRDQTIAKQTTQITLPCTIAIQIINTFMYNMFICNLFKYVQVKVIICSRKIYLFHTNLLSFCILD